MNNVPGLPLDPRTSDGSKVRQGLKRWIDLYKTRRLHFRLNDKTPDEAYWQKTRRAGILAGDLTMKAIHINFAANLT